MFPAASSGLLESHNLQQQPTASGRPSPSDITPPSNMAIRRYPTSGGTVVMSRHASQLPSATSTSKFVAAPNDTSKMTLDADLVSGLSGGRLVGIGSHKDNGLVSADRRGVGVGAMGQIAARIPQHHPDSVLSGHHHRYQAQSESLSSNTATDDVVNLRMAKAASVRLRASPTDKTQVLDLRSVHGTATTDQPLDLTGGALGRKRCLGDNEVIAEKGASSTRECQPIDLSVKRPKTHCTVSGLVQSPMSLDARRFGMHVPYQASPSQLQTHHSNTATGSSGRGGVQVAPSPVPLVQLQLQQQQQQGIGARMELYGAADHRRLGLATTNGRHVPVIHRALPASLSAAASSSGKSSTFRQQSHGTTSGIGHEKHRVGVLPSSLSSSSASSSSLHNVVAIDVSRDVTHANNFRQTATATAMRGIVPEHRGGASKVGQHLYQRATQQKLLPKYSTTGDSFSMNDKLAGPGGTQDRLQQQRAMGHQQPLQHSGIGVHASGSNQSLLRNTTAGGRVLHSTIGSDFRPQESNESASYVTPPPPPPLIRQPGVSAPHQLLPNRRPLNVVGTGRVRAQSWSLPVGMDPVSRASSGDIMSTGRLMSSTLLCGEVDSADALYFRNTTGVATSISGSASSPDEQHLQRDVLVVGEVVQQSSPYVGSGGFVVDRSKLFPTPVGGVSNAARGLSTSSYITAVDDRGYRSASNTIAVVDEFGDRRLVQSSSTLPKSLSRRCDRLSETDTAMNSSVILIDDSNDRQRSSEMDERLEMTVSAVPYTPSSNTETSRSNSATMGTAANGPSTNQTIVTQRDLPSVISRPFDRLEGSSSTPGVGGLTTSPGLRRGIPIANVHPIMKDSSSSLSSSSVLYRQSPLLLKPTTMAPAAGFLCSEKQEFVPSTSASKLEFETPHGAAGGHVGDSNLEISKTTVVDVTNDEGMSSTIKDIPDIPLLLGGQGSSVVSASGGRPIGTTSLSSHHMEYVKFLQQISPVDDVRPARGASIGLGGSISHRGGGRGRHQKQQPTPQPLAPLGYGDKKRSESGRGGRSSTSGIARKQTSEKKMSNSDRKAAAARRQLLMNFGSCDVDKCEVELHQEVACETLSGSKTALAVPDSRFRGGDAAVVNMTTSLPVSFESSTATDVKVTHDGSCSTMTSSSSASSTTSMSHKKTPIVYFDEDESSSINTVDDGEKTGSDVTECKSVVVCDAATAKKPRKVRNEKETKGKISRMAKRCIDGDTQHHHHQEQDQPRRVKAAGTYKTKKPRVNNDQLSEIDGLKDSDSKTTDSSISRKEESNGAKNESSNISPSVDSGRGRRTTSAASATASAAAAAAAIPVAASDGGGKKRRRTNIDLLIGGSNSTESECFADNVDQDGDRQHTGNGWKRRSADNGLSSVPSTRGRRRKIREGNDVATYRGRGGGRRSLSGARRYQQGGLISKVEAEWPAADALCEHDPTNVDDAEHSMGNCEDDDDDVNDDRNQATDTHNCSRSSAGRPKTTVGGRRKNHGAAAGFQYPDVFGRRRMRGATSARRRPRRRYSFVSGGEPTSFDSGRTKVGTGRWDPSTRSGDVSPRAYESKALPSTLNGHELKLHLRKSPSIRSGIAVGNKSGDSSKSTSCFELTNEGSRPSASYFSSSWSLSSAFDSPSAGTSSTQTDPYCWTSDALQLSPLSSTPLKVTSKHLRGGGVSRGRPVCRRRGLKQPGCKRRLETTPVTQADGKYMPKNNQQLGLDQLRSINCFDDVPHGDPSSVGQTVHQVVGDELILSTTSAGVDKEPAGETVLHKASRYNYQELVLYLLKSGMISANVQDNSGQTPLHISCSLGHLTVAKLLLAFGALPNCKTVDGSRPIHGAVVNGHLHVVRQLLQCGADVTLPDGDGRTVLQLAARRPMRLFIRGVIGDLGCDGPKSREIPWDFHSSFENQDCDVLDNAPPSDDEDRAADVTFDVSVHPLLPVYRLQPDWNKRARIFHRLDDVVSASSKSADSFKDDGEDDERQTLKAINSVLFTSDTIKHELRPPVWNRSAAEQLMSTVNDGLSVPLVELDDVVKRLTGVETAVVDAALSLSHRRVTDRQPLAVKVKLDPECTTSLIVDVASVKVEYPLPTSPLMKPLTSDDFDGQSAGGRRESAVGNCGGSPGDNLTIGCDEIEDAANPRGQPLPLVDVDEPSSLSPVVESIHSNVVPEVSDCQADIVCETSPSAASDTLLLLPVLEKHEVPSTAAGNRVEECGSVGFHPMSSTADPVERCVDLGVGTENCCDDITSSSRPEVSAVDRKSACFHEDDDDREMPELTLYA